jgi:hypothetical protein
MSRTYEIFCKDCEKTLWIGQGYVSPGDTIELIQEKGKPYSSAEYIVRLRDFLFSHMGHSLGFDDSEWIDPLVYEDIFPYEEDSL